MDAVSLKVGLGAARHEDHELVSTLLCQPEGSEFELDTFSTAKDARQAIDAAAHDAFVIDSALAASDPGLLPAAVATGRPVVVITAEDECHASLMEAGAWDCLSHGALTPALLARTLRLGVHHARRWQAERLRLQAAKMEAIARFAGGVAHDFNNLLTAMLGYSEMLRESLDEGDERREDVGEIQKAGERAAALTRQFLTFGLRHPVQPTLLDVNDVVQRVSAILPPLLGDAVRLAVHATAPPAPVRADATQLELMLFNLAKNARDAMPSGGCLRIQTDVTEVSEAAAAQRIGARPGRHAVIAVTDDGRGMTPEALAHLFEPFFTTKDKGKGTGLGLAMVYGIVRQAGGHVTIDSRPGKGTRVTVYLPVAGG